VLTRSFIVTRASTGFIKIEIVWKRTDWETDIVHLRIRSNGGTWTEEEDTLVETLYPTADAAEIIQALPTRTWTAIKNRSSELGVKRISNASNTIQPYVAYFNVSLQDALYAREHDLDVNDKNPQWRM
jgi:hypothetical protein